MASAAQPISQSNSRFGPDHSPKGKFWPVGDQIVLPESLGARFIVSVDTEEEFDWAKPFDRASTASAAIAALPDAVERFNAQDLKPSLLCDWPVVTNPDSAAIIRDLARSGNCEIGTHLHPWVTPPHREEVNHRNSFTGNLSQELQWEKLKAITSAIQGLTGETPIVFRAGRYGLGTATHAMLAELGYRFDVSIRSGFDYSSEGGPDFRGYPIWPWHTPEGLIEVPLTTTLIGSLRNLPYLGLPGSTRLGLQSRVPLTPEGTPVGEAVKAIRQLHKDGQRLFSLSFHSPSLVAGHTAYVRNARELGDFWEWWAIVIAAFHMLGVKNITHAELLDALEGDA